MKEAHLPGRVQSGLDRKRGIIWLDFALTDIEARCCLAFELGHLKMGPPPADPRLAAAHRRAAEEWAAQMLIPGDVFAAAWGACLNLGSMAAYCGVDLPTFRNRIRASSNADQDAAMLAIVSTRLSA